MAQETAKERIENEIKSVEKRLHRGRNYGKTYNTGVKEGLMIARAHVIDSSTTDKLSVEKLQEQNKTMKLALVELSDENIYDNTGFFSDEDAKNLVEQLDAGEIETIVERCNRNLQEQLNTAKKALTEIEDVKRRLEQTTDFGVGFQPTYNALAFVVAESKKALAAIGGIE